MSTKKTCRGSLCQVEIRNLTYANACLAKNRGFCSTSHPEWRKTIAYVEANDCLEKNRGFRSTSHPEWRKAISYYANGCQNNVHAGVCYVRLNNAT